MSTTKLDNTATTPRVARVAHNETRPARKTTELLAYLATVLAVVVTAFVVGDDDNGVDAFGAAQALQYVRTRHGLAGGDFDRIKRQQNFIRVLIGDRVRLELSSRDVTRGRIVERL